MKLYTIDTGFFKLDGGAMFGVVPKTIWNNLNPSDENNRCRWAMRCLLVEDGDRLILIDTGMGDYHPEKFMSIFEPHGDNTLLTSLKKHGFSPDDITDVLLTHLHFDHAGGGVGKNRVGSMDTLFKNAVYWTNEKHWQWALHPNAREKASFLKVFLEPMEKSGQLKFLNEGKLNDAISLEHVYGHTEAMLIPKINYNGTTVCFMADLIPSAAHIPVNYVMGYDIRPMEAMMEKNKFLKEASENDYILFFEHDKDIECCSLSKTERGYSKGEVFRLDEI